MNPLQGAQGAAHSAGHGAASGLGKVTAWAGGHKLVLAAGGAGVVVLLALRNRSAASSTAATTGAVSSPQGATVAGYDSSANDIYNALQPQIDQTQALIRKLLSREPKPPKAKTPKPPKTPKTPQGGKPPRRRKIRGTKTPGTKPHPRRPTSKVLSPRLGSVTSLPPARRAATPAPVAAPTGVVTRRPTTLSQLGAAAGVPVTAVAALNPTAVPLGTSRVPTGTRVVIPTTTRSSPTR